MDDNKSPREVAEQLANLSIFIREGFCKGMVMIALPVYKNMNHLSKRLHSYACGLANDAVPRFIPIPNQNTTLDLSAAIEAMEYLALFFENTARRLRQSELADANEVALAKDLKLVARYSKMLLATTTSTFENDPQHDHHNGELMASGALPHDGRDLAGVLPPEPFSDILGSDPLGEQDLPTPMSPIVENGRNFRFDRSTRDRIQPTGGFKSPKTSEELLFASVFPPRSTTPPESHTPADLRPVPHEPEHAPHVLAGPRLDSRCGIMDGNVFMESFAHDEILLLSTPNAHTTVQLGHGTELSPDNVLLVYSTKLEMPGTDAIRLVLPLCPREIRMLDYDALRYIDLALHHEPKFRNISSDAMKQGQSIVLSEAIRKSRAFTQREIACRAFEIERQAMYGPQDDSHTAGELLERTNSWPDEDWSYIPRGNTGAVLGGAPLTHEPTASGYSPSLPLGDAVNRHDEDHEPTCLLAVDEKIFRVSLDPPADPRELLNASRLAIGIEDTSSTVSSPDATSQPQANPRSDVMVPGASVPASGHGGPETGSGIGQDSPRAIVSPIAPRSASREKSHTTSESARQRRAEAKALDAARTWSVESPPTSPGDRRKGDWTTVNRSVKSESSWKHDDWIEKALAGNERPHYDDGDQEELQTTPNTTVDKSDIEQLKSQMSDLQQQVADLTALLTKLSLEDLELNTALTLEPPEQPTHDLQHLVGQRELISSSSMSAQANTSNKSTQGPEMEEWVEEPDAFRGRSSPPYVAYTNRRDGKSCILDTSNGVPEPLARTPLRSSRGRQRIESVSSTSSNEEKMTERLALQMEGKSGDGMILNGMEGDEDDG